MDTEEHLKKIVAKCKSLLAGAEKRTLGEWYASHNKSAVYTHHYPKNNQVAYTGFPNGDASFIASCAGPAEAGWRATIAAIEGLTLTCKGFKFPDEDRPDAWNAIQAIIAAWPDELL